MIVARREHRHRAAGSAQTAPSEGDGGGNCTQDRTPSRCGRARRVCGRVRLVGPSRLRPPGGTPRSFIDIRLLAFTRFPDAMQHRPRRSSRLRRSAEGSRAGIARGRGRGWGRRGRYPQLSGSGAQGGSVSERLIPQPLGGWSQMGAYPRWNMVVISVGRGPARGCL